MTADRSVDDLLAACQRGDGQAWTEFVRRYSKLVYSVANRYRLPGAEAEDVHQAVFLAAVRHLDQVREAEKVVPWLVTTAHRECWRLARRKNLAVDLAADFADIDEPSSDRLAEQEALQALREVYPSLPERCQTLLRVLFSAGSRPDYEAISQSLGLAVGSIGPTRMRCLQKLAELMARKGYSVDLPEGGGAPSEP